MPDDDLLSPSTTRLTTAGSLREALAAADGPADLLVVDETLAPEVAAAGITVPGLDAMTEGSWPTDVDTLVELGPGLGDGEGGREGGPVVRRVLAAAPAPDAAGLRVLAARVGRTGLGLGSVIVAVAGDASDDAPAALAEGLVLGGHRPAVRSGAAARPGSDVAAAAEPAGSTTLVLPGDPGRLQADFAAALVRACASLVARDLANTPSNVKSPQWMVERAEAVARRRGLRIVVTQEQELAEGGFGGLTAVGGGSATPPRLVELAYEPDGSATAGRPAPHVVLVGKGITFDTGGIDVKPAAAMSAMRTDMSGSAIVLAVVDAAAALHLPVRVTALLPLAENALGGSSYRPSDVITPYGGRRTVEVTNTDAEGRLVLADALAYADDHLDPDVMVDVATLTGAARVALARSMSALFTDDDDLAAGLTAAGERAGEPTWRLPLHTDYRALLDSPVADLDNAPGTVGAVTAALFLKEFVGERRWAHLDIAGPGRSDDDTGLLAKGATGYGARTLLTWLGGLS